MNISFYGENCFKIQSGDFVILTDPIDAKSGLSSPRFKYDAILKTLVAYPLPQMEDGIITVQNAGEYNFNNIAVNGFLLEKESAGSFLKNIFIIQTEDIKICVLGYLSEIPTSDIMEKMEETDILLMPAGGKPFIEQKIAMKLIRQIQPKIIIPALYKIPGLKRNTDDLKIFLEEFNHGKVEPQEKLNIKKKDLAGVKSSQLIILKT
ncbi:MAG: MBL fold metallo-hydrolase [Patescibacteria group bacterium]|nr:MBL fold metallo-hydrolase [Patescibacteria group bacterium]